MKSAGNFKRRLILFGMSLLMALLPLTSGIQVKASSVYYVSTSGNDSNSGASTGSAWRTIAHAATHAQAGDTVYIQAGNYGHERVVFSNSGTSTAPIEFVGCDNSWNPIPEPGYYDIYSTGGITPPEPDYSAMPYIDGLTKTDNGITAAGKSYITIKNIQVVSYRNGISIENNCNHIILNNVRVYWCCEENIRLFAPDYCQILNSIAHGAGMGDIALGGAQNCLIENSLATDNSGHHQNEPDTETDYYIHLTSQVTGSTGRDSYGNTVRHCLAFNALQNPHGVHGIVLKSMFNAPMHNNLIEDCVSNTMASNFQLRHSNVYDNTIKDCIAYDLGVTYTESGAFVCRDGAYNNKFINCKGRHVSGTNTSRGVYMYDSVENSMGDVNGDDTYSGYGNKFINCTFEDYTYAIDFGYWTSGYNSPACNNVFENCNFINNNSGGLVLNESASNNNVMRNCIVQGFNTGETYTGSGSGNITYSYSCFNSNNFSAPTGTGIITSDPLFADAVNRDYHLKSEYGRWNGSEWVNDASTSLCIDAGDPASVCSNEPAPHGGRINIGSYGNTAQASKSSTDGISPTPTPETGTWHGNSNWTAATHSLGDGNTGIVTIEFDITPLKDNMDSDVGFTGSSVTPLQYSDLCMFLKMHSSGVFAAVNYDHYDAKVLIPYSANITYHVKIAGNISARTYDVWVTPPGGSATMIADDYGFRNDGPAITDIGKVCCYAPPGDDYYITNHLISSTSTWYGNSNWTAATHSLGDGNTGIVAIEFDVTPLQNNMDSDIGYTGSTITPAQYSDLCMFFKMHSSGVFAAVDYDHYDAKELVPYSANITYHVKMVGNIPAGAYDVWVAPPGGSAIMIADDYGFRSNGPTITDVGKVCCYAPPGDSYSITNHSISSLSSTPAPPPPPPTDTGTWYGKLDWTAATHSLGDGNTGIVTMEFDVKPLQNNMDSDIGYTGSSVTPGDYSSLDIILEMDSSGHFTAVNYDGYYALTTIPYSANNTYHIKIVGNISARTYDAWVTPAGGSEIMLADDYRFRSNGPQISDIGKVCCKTSTADDDYCITNHTISSSPPKPTPTPPVLDYNDVGTAGDNDAGQHTPGVSIYPDSQWNSPSSVDGYTVRVAPAAGASLYANITDRTKNYYIKILYKSNKKGKLRQFNGKNYKDIGVYTGDDNWRTLRVLLDTKAYYYDDNGAGSNSAANVLLTFSTSITLADMWLEVE